MRVFIGQAQAFGKRHRCRQRLFHVVWGGLQQGRVEDARQDGVDPNALTHQVPRNRQGHAHDGRLAGRVTRLTYLPILCRHRRGVDDGATFAVQQVQAHHAGRRLGDAPEGPHQVDLNDAVEIGGGE